MNNRLRYFLTPLIFIVFVCASTCIAYSQQQTAENSPGSISGHLTTAQKPLPNIEVLLIIPAIVAKDQRARHVTVLTDETGYYQFTGLAPAEYVVIPKAKKFVPIDVKKIYEDSQSIKVESGQDVTNIDFELIPGAKIQGQIKDADGNPVIGQKVLLTVVSGNQNQTQTAAVTFGAKAFDDQGNYTVENAWPGRYVVSVEGSADYSVMVFSSLTKRQIYGRTFYPGTTKLAEATAVELKSGETITGIDITVERSIRTYQISGRVIDEQTGAPKPYVEMGIVFTGSDGVASDIVSVYWRTDSEGRFRMPVIFPGHVIVKVIPKDATGQLADQVDLGLIDKDISGLEIKMHHAPTLSGQVVTSFSGR